MRLLTFHAGYACRHAGACCNAGWIEPLPDGCCRFFDAHPSGSCSVHRAHGPEALPHACQQFPRIVTESPLGVSLTLSAFCPTAASLLFEPGPFGITTRDAGRRYEGLDARDVMPPLLRKSMLMDWERVARWEELAVGTLSDVRDDVDEALAIIERASAEVCETWTPAAGAIAGTLRDAFARAGERQNRSVPTPGRRLTMESAVARFLASHAFACWAMYAGQGIAGAITHLQTVRATLDEESARLASDAGRALDATLLKEAFRQTDLRLRHAV